MPKFNFDEPTKIIRKQRIVKTENKITAEKLREFQLKKYLKEKRQRDKLKPKLEPKPVIEIVPETKKVV